MEYNDLRRAFANYPADPAVLTINGLIYDWVHYRHNRPGIAELIDNNHRFTPFHERLEEDGKILVPIRCWDFDIDMIEVLDKTTGKYHPMWSTDPDYTGGLSRWEHRFYLKLLKARNGGSARQKGRIAAKAKQDRLTAFDDELWKMGMRERSKASALIAAEEKRAKEIAEAEATQNEESEGGTSVRSWSMTPAGANRKDIPRPPPQSRGSVKRKRREHTPPRRDNDYGSASTAPLSRSGSAAAGNSKTPSKTAEKFKFKKR